MYFTPRPSVLVVRPGSIATHNSSNLTKTHVLGTAIRQGKPPYQGRSINVRVSALSISVGSFISVQCSLANSYTIAGSRSLADRPYTIRGSPSIGITAVHVMSSLMGRNSQELTTLAHKKFVRAFSPDSLGGGDLFSIIAPFVETMSTRTGVEPTEVAPPVVGENLLQPGSSSGSSLPRFNSPTDWLQRFAARNIQENIQRRAEATPESAVVFTIPSPAVSVGALLAEAGEEIEGPAPVVVADQAPAGPVLVAEGQPPAANEAEARIALRLKVNEFPDNPSFTTALNRRDQVSDIMKTLIREQGLAIDAYDVEKGVQLFLDDDMQREPKYRNSKLKKLVDDLSNRGVQSPKFEKILNEIRSLGE